MNHGKGHSGFHDSLYVNDILENLHCLWRFSLRVTCIYKIVCGKRHTRCDVVETSSIVFPYFHYKEKQEAWVNLKVKKYSLFVERWPSYCFPWCIHCYWPDVFQACCQLDLGCMTRLIVYLLKLCAAVTIIWLASISIGQYFMPSLAANCVQCRNYLIFQYLRCDFPNAVISKQCFLWF